MSGIPFDADGTGAGVTGGAGTVGRRASHVWGVLSGASHYHPYDLTPTREELVTWCDTLQDVTDVTERAWRRA